MANLMIYGKHKDDKRFTAMNIRDMTFGNSLMYASLIPEEKIDELKNLVNDMISKCPDFRFEVRKAGTNTKVGL